MTIPRTSPAVARYLRYAVRRIRTAFPETRRIILFGSHAYGVPTNDSDLDLFIEMPSRRPSRERYQQVQDLLDPRPMGIDVIIKTPQETRRILRDFNPCFQDIVEKGRVLYAKKG